MYCISAIEKITAMEGYMEANADTNLTAYCNSPLDPIQGGDFSCFSIVVLVLLYAIHSCTFCLS